MSYCGMVQTNKLILQEIKRRNQELEAKVTQLTTLCTKQQVQYQEYLKFFRETKIPFYIPTFIIS